MTKYVYGIDIGGTNIKIGLFSTPKIKLVTKKEVKTPLQNQEVEIFEKIVKELEKINAANNIKFEDIEGIGLTVPCPIVNGVVGICSNVCLDSINLEEELAKRLPVKLPIASANDANMAAFGEFKTSNTEINNAVFYTLGTGVGGGLIVNGEMIEGKHGNAAEFGHMKVFDGLKTECGCGSNGCLEQMAGTNALFRMVKEHSLYEASILEEKENYTIKDIFDAAKMRDRVATRVVDRAMEALAISASILAVTVDPDVFIIGGGISNAGNIIIEKLEFFYEKHARLSTKNTPFVLAKLKNDAGIYGAAHLVYERHVRK